MACAKRRLLRDLRRLQEDPPHGVNGAPIKNNIFRWRAVIFGPEDSLWEGATFHLELAFVEEYPNKPPEVKFVSRIFHPNVYNDGKVCLDILQNQWSPIYDISAILTSIQSLLTDPNPDSPANVEAARLYAENRREYNRRVQQCVLDSLEMEPDEALMDAEADAESDADAEENTTAADIRNNSSSSRNNTGGSSSAGFGAGNSVTGSDRNETSENTGYSVAMDNNSNRTGPVDDENCVVEER